MKSLVKLAEGVCSIFIFAALFVFGTIFVIAPGLAAILGMQLVELAVD